MAGKVYSVMFSLTAVIDGKDALTLVTSPSAVIWNQSGDVTVDEGGTIHDNSLWPKKYVVANVMKGGSVDTGWTFSYSLDGCSMTVKKGLYANGQFILMDLEGKVGNAFELSNPKRTTDANGKEVADLWTNGILRITATKPGEQPLHKDVPVALNALATWKLSVVNGTMTAVSSKTEQEFTDKGLTGKNYESRLTQTEKGLSSKVSQTELGAVAAGEGSSADIDLSQPSYDADTFYLAIIFNSANVDESGNGNYFHEVNNSAETYIFGIKKTLMNGDNAEPKTAYGLWKVEDGKGGFDTYLQWHEHFEDWGTRSADRVVDSYTKDWIKEGTFAVGSIGQYKANGPVYVYLRGGTRFHLFCDHTGMTIRLARQGDLDNMPSSDTAKPALAIPLADAIEPVTEHTSIYSEIQQRADRITAFVFDELKNKTGIDIGNGVINAIAGRFNFVGKDGKPYIRVEQDKDGYAHFVFYDPVSDTPSYDLGSTGLSQIIESSQKLSFPRKVGGDFYIGSISTEDNTDVWNLSYENVYTHAMAFYEFHPAYFTKKDNPEKKIYVPGEAEALDGLLYDIPYVSDGLPLGNKVADGWYLYIIAKYDRTKNRGYEVRDDGIKIVNAADESVSSVSYSAYLVVGAKIKANFSINIETYPSTSSMRVPDVKSGGMGLNFSCDDTSEKYISFNKNSGKVYFHNPE